MKEQQRTALVGLLYRTVMDRYGLTLRDVARRAGVDQGQASRFMNSRVDGVPFRTVTAQLLGFGTRGLCIPYETIDNLSRGVMPDGTEATVERVIALANQIADARGEEVAKVYADELLAWLDDRTMNKLTANEIYNLIHGSGQRDVANAWLSTGREMAKAVQRGRRLALGAQAQTK